MEIKIKEIENGYLITSGNKTVFHSTIAEFISYLILSTLEKSPKPYNCSMKDLKLDFVTFKGKDNEYFQFRAFELR